ncbi:four helix bundle protein [Algoriphagus sp. CAU 1675]|uniref:four helix bundle protein n=1 Tax=Algoriphagus sp. CAU 1675 TaxID=3032597 RepID=UPI0023D9F121|nr:four helix bundle protein [Algoriphagus sp. CAU 1675]MDF2159396.1 four helix bundle protein [Algoriphagus sp. CAU 1675]
MERADTFEDLICWQKAYQLKRNIKKVVISNFPRREEYDLKSQILRASRSVTANIAEGWGRYHYLDSNKFYYNSRGSLAEILDHLIEARDDKYINEETFLDLRQQVLEAIKVLNGFIFYLKREYLKSIKKS